MPNTTSNPIPKSRIPRLWKHTSISRLFLTSFYRHCSSLLSPNSIFTSPMSQLSLLSIINQKDKCRRKTKDQETLQYALINPIIIDSVTITSGHLPIIEGCNIVLFIVSIVVVWVIVSKEVADPFAERPLLLFNCGKISTYRSRAITESGSYQVRHEWN